SLHLLVPKLQFGNASALEAPFLTLLFDASQRATEWSKQSFGRRGGSQTWSLGTRALGNENIFGLAKESREGFAALGKGKFFLRNFRCSLGYGAALLVVREQALRDFD